MAKSIYRKIKLNKIIGEKQPTKNEQAIPYLAAYKGKKGSGIILIITQLGYAYYKQMILKMLFQLIKIINGFVAQNAYYHLGESYLKLDKKQEALNALKKLLKCRLTLQSRKTRV
jgi:hypothetical protein